MATAREEIINIYDTLPARYNIGFSEIEEEPGEPIARGTFGSVHRCRWGDRGVAVKKFDLIDTDSSFKLASKEISRMIGLRHQNVLNVYGFYFVPEGRVLKCSMVMELMDVDLYEHIEQRRGEGSPLTDGEVVYIIGEIARGMKHVHENGYSHRDLKPQNVLLRRSAVLTRFQMEVKVADFGSSELISAGQCDRNTGTPRYKAPEQYDRVAPLQPYKMDVYSFGCICFKVWTGEDPPHRNHARLMELWKQRRPRNLPDVEGIITNCLDRNPCARPGFSKISGALDAHVLKEKRIEQVPHREEVIDADVVVRRSEIVKKLQLPTRGVDGLNYADYVILPEELVFHRLLAGGSEATVCEVRWKGAPCALKEFLGFHPGMSPGFQVLPTLMHDNIVRFWGYTFLIPYPNRACPGILMEFLGSDLWDYLRKHNSASFPAQRRWKIMKGIAEGMKFLHDKNWVHGDLKPENVLVDVSDQDDIVVKLIDFSLTSPSILQCTLRYAAPEVFRARRQVITIDYKKSDVFSFAITCSDILCWDKHPDDYSRSVNFRERVMEGMRPELPKETSPLLQDLITRCWSPDPAKRPSFGDVCEFFSGPMPVQDCTRFQNPCCLM